MRNVQKLVGIAGIVFACAPSCATKTNGQLMIAIQTDMALPKDIDRVRIEVTHADSGSVIFKKDFERLGLDKAIRLPATLGITAPEGASTAVSIRVIASQGSDESVKVLREVTTTIPTDRTATLPISLEFLCNGSAEPERDSNNKVKRDSDGVVIVKSTCPENLTCVSGVCTPSAVPSEDLPNYVEAKIFGGGTSDGDGACFDTSTCFDDGTEVLLDLEGFEASNKTVCKVSATGDVNIALRTQGGGICGSKDCFVALDADGASGWKADGNGAILLPPGVCEKARAGEVVGVVTAPVNTAKCKKKQTSLPTCGPWSVIGKDDSMPDLEKPTLIAPGQINPAALAIAGSSVVWTSRGTFDENDNPRSDGTVKIVSVDGGQPQTIASGQASPHGIAVDDTGRQVVLWTNAGGNEIIWASFADPSLTPVGKKLIGELVQPEGITVNNKTVYWTDLATHGVYSVATQFDEPSSTLVLGGSTQDLAPMPLGSSPRGIAAVKGTVCWTYEDKLTTSAGVVACYLSGKSVVIATGQQTPRAIALTGDAKTVYWANFNEAGGIYKADLTKSTFDMSPVAPATYPAGLAIASDGTLFWTNRSTKVGMVTMPGTVNILPNTPEAVAKSVPGQVNPGSIAVTDDTVFWINEGKADLSKGELPDGAIMKIAR